MKYLLIICSLVILISCGGGGGGSADPAPTPPNVLMSFSSDLNEIYIHNKITLTWSSSNADSCSASGDWIGTKPNNGSEEIIIREAKDSTFILNCSSSSSSADRNITVTSISPYLYPDHWDEINVYRESLQSIYENPVGINQEETWFRTFTIPKSRFTTDVTNTFLDDENFRGDVGFDTWINIGDSTFHLNCNWVPQKPNEGAIKSDDGESGAGLVIVRMLERKGIYDHLVVVTRWFGGVQLGGDRFRRVQDCVRYYFENYTN